MDTAVEVFDVWTDMLEAQEDREAHPIAASDAPAFLWDPNDYRPTLKTLKIANYQLSQE